MRINNKQFVTAKFDKCKLLLHFTLMMKREGPSNCFSISHQWWTGKDHLVYIINCFSISHCWWRGKKHLEVHKPKLCHHSLQRRKVISALRSKKITRNMKTSSPEIVCCCPCKKRYSLQACGWILSINFGVIAAAAAVMGLSCLSWQSQEGRGNYRIFCKTCAIDLVWAMSLMSMPDRLSTTPLKTWNVVGAQSKGAYCHSYVGWHRCADSTGPW